MSNQVDNAGVNARHYEEDGEDILTHPAYVPEALNISHGSGTGESEVQTNINGSSATRDVFAVGDRQASPDFSSPENSYVEFEGEENPGPLVSTNPSPLSTVNSELSYSNDSEDEFSQTNTVAQSERSVMPSSAQRRSGAPKFCINGSDEDNTYAACQDSRQHPVKRILTNCWKRNNADRVYDSTSVTTDKVKSGPFKQYQLSAMCGSAPDGRGHSPIDDREPILRLVKGASASDAPETSMNPARSSSPPSPRRKVPYRRCVAQWQVPEPAALPHPFPKRNAVPPNDETSHLSTSQAQRIYPTSKGQKRALEPPNGIQRISMNTEHVASELNLPATVAPSSLTAEELLAQPVPNGVSFLSAGYYWQAFLDSSKEDKEKRGPRPQPAMPGTQEQADGSNTNHGESGRKESQFEDSARASSPDSHVHVFPELVKAGRSKLIKVPADSYRTVLLTDFSDDGSFEKEIQAVCNRNFEVRCMFNDCGMFIVGNLDVFTQHIKEKHPFTWTRSAWHCIWSCQSDKPGAAARPKHTVAVKKSSSGSTSGHRCKTWVKSSSTRVFTHIFECHVLVWKWWCFKCGRLLRLQKHDIKKHYEKCSCCPKCNKRVKESDRYFTHVENCRVCAACGKEVQALEDYHDHVAECMKRSQAKHASATCARQKPLQRQALRSDFKEDDDISRATSHEDGTFRKRVAQAVISQNAISSMHESDADVEADGNKIDAGPSRIPYQGTNYRRQDITPRRTENLVSLCNGRPRRSHQENSRVSRYNDRRESEPTAPVLDSDNSDETDYESEQDDTDFLLEGSSPSSSSAESED